MLKCFVMILQAINETREIVLVIHQFVKFSLEVPMIVFGFLMKCNIIFEMNLFLNFSFFFFFCFLCCTPPKLIESKSNWVKFCNIKVGHVVMKWYLKYSNQMRSFICILNNNCCCSIYHKNILNLKDVILCLNLRKFMRHLLQEFSVDIFTYATDIQLVFIYKCFSKHSLYFIT